MSVKTKYISKVGKDYKVSKHITLGELQCDDGTDKVMYDTTIIKRLEKFRKKYNGVVDITSAYRTAHYNANMKPRGAINSAHIDGKAIDFKIKANGKVISPKLICLELEAEDWKGGIGQMNTATHIDTKFVGNKMDETKTPYYYLQKHGLTFRKYYGIKDAYTGYLPKGVVNKDKGTKADIKKWQKFLCWYGENVKIDGKFGDDTEEKTIIFQKENGLKKDGSVGDATREVASKVKK